MADSETKASFGGSEDHFVGGISAILRIGLFLTGIWSDREMHLGSVHKKRSNRETTGWWRSNKASGIDLAVQF
jgi:hypothetical protein